MVLGLKLSIHMEKGKNLICCLFLGVTGVPDGERNKESVSSVAFCNIVLSLQENDDHSH